VARLLSEAAALSTLPGLSAVSCIRGRETSDFDLAFLFEVESLRDLEGFGTDQRYIRFLQGGLGQALRSFGGADVLVDGEATLPAEAGFAGCAAVACGPQTYDWQVRAALNRWTAGATAVSGLAVGERQRYRGLAVMFSDRDIARPAAGFEGFGVDFIHGAYRRLT
jgi:hypothetical protein